MIIELTAGLSGVTALSGLIWAIRQEGRINAHDALFVEREKQAELRHQMVKDALDRIERKMEVEKSHN